MSKRNKTVEAEHQPKPGYEQPAIVRYAHDVLRAESHRVMHEALEIQPIESTWPTDWFVSPYRSGGQGLPDVVILIHADGTWTFKP